MNTFDEEEEVVQADELDDRDTQSIVADMLDQATKWYEQHLEPRQVEATEFYEADAGILPFDEGRSQVTSSDLRDAVRFIMPSLLRIFSGPDRTLTFRPEQPDDEPLVKQVTEYMHHLIWEANPGFMTFHSVLKDALIRKIGVVKWWVEDKVRVTGEELVGLSLDQLALLEQEEGVELEITGQYEEQLLPEESGMPPTTLYDASLTRTKVDKLIRVAAVPPNEILWTPNARNFDDAPLVAHVRKMKAGELIAMGIDREQVIKARSAHNDKFGDSLENARSLDGGDLFASAEQGDDSVQPVLFAEAYVLIDVDGDGIPERRMFQCLGPDYKIVNGVGTLVDDVPFADFPMDPEAHSIIGHCLHDYLRDVQLVKSRVLRATLDSLALALDQKTEVVTDMVNIQDITKNELGGVIRVRKPGMMREVRHEFLGGETLSVLAYYDELKENRTGVSKAAAGLDADALQSSTKAAVTATFSAAQQHIEMIARVLAETGMRRLFKGLLRTVVRHQDRAKLVKLRDEYVEVDPRSWNAEMDVQITLQSGTPEERMNVLGTVSAKQMELLQLGVPLVGPSEIRNTLARILELAGFKNADEFFKPWGPEEEQQAQEQAQQQPQQQDPTAMLAQVESEKAQMQAQAAQQKLELDWWKAQQENDRERDKIARDFAMKEMEIRLKYQTLGETEQLYASVERDRATMELDLQAQQAQQQAEQEAQMAAQQAEMAAQQPAEGVEV
jgi:hypothetical protein